MFLEFGSTLPKCIFLKIGLIWLGVYGVHAEMVKTLYFDIFDSEVILLNKAQNNLSI